MVQDLTTLQNIADTLEMDPMASQRTLAANSGMSVGLMNAVLKRFVERGWIMLTNINGRKLAYALTSEGINELAERGKKFAVRTFKIANKYSETILNVVRNAKKEGKTKVTLCGDSYIKFLIEYACREEEIEFEIISVTEEFFKTEFNEKIRKNSYNIVGELNTDQMQKKLVDCGCVDLLDLVN